ncbi:MAG: hypothetical protein H9Q65_05585 [Spiroplasma ixodetis]|nr:hypothetical protein [Spiroplasma ixodetis]MBP1527057.1 hypothetical protein [Spiroplasma ixodetis]MBP1528695.1 hypothetical protein [Spiroplasma ixodetis]
MFKNIWKYFKNDPYWKNIMKICVVYSISLILSFWFFLSLILIVGIPNNFKNIDKSVFKGFIFICQTSIISYSLSIFIINSNEIQQQKYRFLWLFLYFLALNPFGIISILLLMKKQKKEKDIFIEKQEIIIKIKPEKWFILWAIYTSIVMMICIVTVPLSIINLINIKKNWKKEEIDIKDLKKIAYFSSDWTLMLASKFAF